MKNADFQRVKEAADLETVVRHYAPGTELKRAGPRWRGLCPLHAENTPSFFVQRARFHCHGCKRGGDVFDFLAELKGFTPAEALHDLARLFNLALEETPGNAQKPPFKPATGKSRPDVPVKGKNATEGKLGPFTPRFLDPGKVAPTLEPEKLKGNNLFRFLSRYYGEPAVSRVFDLYRVGTDGDRAVFWHIDREGRVRSGQKIPYPPDGHHRRKDVFPPVVTEGPPGGINFCFFGEHLLASFPPGARVQVVESAKTALVCAVEDPGGIWIATGGKGNLGEGDVRRWEALKGRTVVLHPDLETPPGDKSPPPPTLWELALPTLQKMGVHATIGTAAERLATPEEKRAKCDLADLFLARREGAALIPAGPPPVQVAERARRIFDRIHAADLTDLCDRDGGGVHVRVRLFRDVCESCKVVTGETPAQHPDGVGHYFSFLLELERELFGDG
jgi:hypothetical protein